MENKTTKDNMLKISKRELNRSSNKPKGANGFNLAFCFTHMEWMTCEEAHKISHMDDVFDLYRLTRMLPMTKKMEDVAQNQLIAIR